jgi:hypothetical protein
MLTSNQHSVSSLLSSYATGLRESINQLTSTSFDNIFSYDLDCTLLNDFGKQSIQCETTLKFIKDIEEHNHLPAVYWFEIVSDHDSKEIYTSVVDLKKTSIRNMPAFKKHLKDYSSVLYVGKVKKNLAGRMLLHLGYNTAPSVQGLQLCHWPNKDGLNLKLNVIYLPQDLDMLAGVFEVQIAKELNPILGKHR